jgi:hypothetical protein
MQSMVNDIIVSLVSWIFDVILKYQYSKSKSQIIDGTSSFLSTIGKIIILSINKTFSLIDTSIVKNFIVFKQFYGNIVVSITYTQILANSKY